MKMRVLITLGGSDPHNDTRRVIAALDRIDGLDLVVTAIVGPSNPYLSELELAVAQTKLTINMLVSPENMAELMSSADAVITSSGGTFIEALVCRVPAMVLRTASNQDISYAYAAAHNVA